MANSKNHIEAMFDDIAPNYDLLNHLFSLGFDRYWRRVVIKQLIKHKSTKILDIATGTADLPILQARKIKNADITATDVSEAMLKKGKRKIDKLKLSRQIILNRADGHNLPYPDNTFEATTIAFGLRNFENPVQGVNEMFRVIKSGGISIILEFSEIKNRPIAWLFKQYFVIIVPIVGKIVSKHKTAYSYLPKSVYEFNQRYSIVKIMQQAGYENIKTQKLTFGIATIYSGIKKTIKQNNN